jgi:TatD DNase family protein
LQRQQGLGFPTTTTTTACSMTSSSTSPPSFFKFVDIGANLLDERFTEGSYHGKQRHEPDWEAVLQRASDNGVSHIILTAGTIRESRRAVELVRELRLKNETIYFGCTVGVHPTRCQQEFVDKNDNDNDNDASPDQLLKELREIAVDGQTDKSVVALGEIGLDYDRLEFCPKDVQKLYLEEQLKSFHSVEELRQLPLFLHNRNVGSDLLDVLKDKEEGTRGVVHSFDDSLDLALQFIESGLYIGLNGCSLKTEEHLKVVKDLPLDKILLETDCPYCEIKASHAGFGYVTTKFEKKVEKKFELGKMVKGRNEPCQMIQVAEVIAGVKGVTVKEVADACYDNSMRLYGWEI